MNFEGLGTVLFVLIVVVCLTAAGLAFLVN